MLHPVRSSCAVTEERLDTVIVFLTLVDALMCGVCSKLLDSGPPRKHHCAEQ